MRNTVGTAKNTVGRYFANTSAIERGRRPLAHQDRRGAAAERDRQAVAQAVGEEQARHREQAIVGLQVVDLARHALHGPRHVAMAVHRALRLAGAARGVEHEARRVALELRPAARFRVLQQLVRENRVRCARRLRVREMLRRDDDQFRFAVLEHVGKAFGREQRAARHGDRAHAHDAEERDHHLRRVAHHQRHAIARPDAARGERAAAARRRLLELAVGDFRSLKMNRNPVGAARGVLGDVIDYAAFHGEKLREQYEKAEQLGKLAIAYGSTLQRTIRLAKQGTPCLIRGWTLDCISPRFD